MARIDTLHPGLIQVTSDQPTGWSDSAHAWRFRTTLRIQPKDGAPGELLQPGSLAVDGWGRIYVADTKPAAIKVFDSTGAYLRTIGREGAGPGEYRVAFIAVRGPHLVVQDPMQSRTSVFDTSGTFIRSWQSACCHLLDIIIDSAGLAYIPSPSSAQSPDAPNRGLAYLRYRLEGTPVDTLYVAVRPDASKFWTFSSGNGVTSRNTTFMGIPFSPRSVHVLHPDGGFVTGWTGEYRIMRSPSGQDTSMILARSWVSDAIPVAMRQEQVDKTIERTKGTFGEANAREIAKLSDVPSTAPAYLSLRVDQEGNVWARHLVGSDSTRTLYDVFSPAGAWLGPVTLPAAVREYGSQFFGKGVIYSVGEDDDGRPMILRVNRVN